MLGRLLQLGWTPLYWAASYGQKEAVDLLLGAGAATDAADKVKPAPSIGWVGAACGKQQLACISGQDQDKFTRATFWQTY
jgi:hypothetical protein